MEKNTKSIAIKIIFFIVVIIILCIGGIFFYRQKDYVNVNDDEKMLTKADEYILHWNHEASIIEHSKVIKKPEMGIAAILVKYKMEQEDYVSCVYFVCKRKNVYYLEGAQETACGEIVADSQYVNGEQIMFIRGMDIPQTVTSFRIDEIGYEAEVTGTMYLDIIATDASRYEVKLVEE